MEEHEKGKIEPSPTSMHRMVLKIFHFKVSNLGKMDIAILLKYDVTDAMLQDNKKMKVQYLKSLLYDLFC